MQLFIAELENQLSLYYSIKILIWGMSVLFILIIISLIVAVGFLFAFFWAVRSGQFEDDYTPSIRMLFDDDLPEEKESKADSDKVEIIENQS